MSQLCITKKQNGSAMCGCTAKFRALNRLRTKMHLMRVTHTVDPVRHLYDGNFAVHSNPSRVLGLNLFFFFLKKIPLPDLPDCGHARWSLFILLFR